MSVKVKSAAVVAEVQRQLQPMADIECVAWGGYGAAERCRIVFGREEIIREAKHDPSSLSVVQALQARQPAVACVCTCGGCALPVRFRLGAI